MTDRAADPWLFYARFATTRVRTRDSRVEAVFALVPHEDFLIPGPWSRLAPVTPHNSLAPAKIRPERRGGDDG